MKIKKEVKQFNIRLEPALHQELRIFTIKKNTTQNDFVTKAIIEKLEREGVEIAKR